MFYLGPLCYSWDPRVKTNEAYLGDNRMKLLCCNQNGSLPLTTMAFVLHLIPLFQLFRPLESFPSSHFTAFLNAFVFLYLGSCRQF
jgi:hypothetical protein